MTRPTLSDLSPRVQAQVAAQLSATPHPRTVAIQVAEPVTLAKLKMRRKGASNAKFFALLAMRGIRAPETEYRFATDRRWRFDYAWPDVRVALEVEGGIWTGGRHTSGVGFTGDIEKYNRAAILGWRVVRCVPSELCSRPTVEMVGRMLAA